MPAIYYVRTTIKRKLWKIYRKNDEPRVTTNQSLYNIHSSSKFWQISHTAQNIPLTFRRKTVFERLVRPATHFLYFAFRGYFANVFAKHTTKYEALIIHFRISCEFRVLLMPRKNKPRNPFTFRANVNLGAKCCEMWKNCFTNKANMTNHVLQIHHLCFAFFSHFHTFLW